MTFKLVGSTEIAANPSPALVFPMVGVEWSHDTRGELGKFSENFAVRCLRHMLKAQTLI